MYWGYQPTCPGNLTGTSFRNVDVDMKIQFFSRCLLWFNWDVVGISTVFLRHFPINGWIWSTVLDHRLGISCGEIRMVISQHDGNRGLVKGPRSDVETASTWYLQKEICIYIYMFMFIYIYNMYIYICLHRDVGKVLVFFHGSRLTQVTLPLRSNDPAGYWWHVHQQNLEASS